MSLQNDIIRVFFKFKSSKEKDKKRENFYFGGGRKNIAL